MRLVLCDNNRLLCEALGAALEVRGHKVLAIATSAELGIAAVAEHDPDACLLALRFPSPPDGMDAARRILEISPGTAVLMLSGQPEQNEVLEAVRMGVAGFLRKEQDVNDVVEALEIICAGGVAVDPALMSQRHVPRKPPPRYELTPREREVLRRIAAGESTTQMARSMNIATSTLRTYIRNVLVKLGVHSRLQAAALAAREHLTGERTSQ